MSIAARNLRFELSDDIANHWAPEHPEFSHIANAFMAALPYLEPYFIHNIRQAAEQLDDEALKADVRGFIAQEARHAQQHKRWNEVIARRFPGFDRLERALKNRLSESKRTHSLAFRMAYTAGYEAFTYQLVCCIMNQRKRWLHGADPRLLGMLSWHAAEEVEHKSVAFDVFQAIDGGYAMRIFGYVVALVRSIADIHEMTDHMLSADQTVDPRQSRRRLRAVRIALLKELGPELLHYFKPNYSPSEHEDPALLKAWLAHYDHGEDLRALDLGALDALAQSA
ncbi:MAG TPA: metal-dependent hydrolase [Polyangiales bacterium]|nr:metal-dependent hydrolase [Polyangiales bacterium]